MALGWMTALKLVPWGDVIEATPQILQAARKLLGKTQGAATDAATSPPPDAQALAGSTPAVLAAQLQQLADRVGRLEQEQQESALLIQSLAEQNAQVVRAVDALRVRNRRLTAAVAALAALCAGLLLWTLRA